MAAFANSEGGIIFLGVADDGQLLGFTPEDIRRLNQLIANVAAQHIRSLLTVQTENVKLPGGKVVIALTVPKGLDKPYFDKNGVIWLKSGADKRRVNSKEEQRRVFQSVDQFHADELPTKAGIEKLDKWRFRDFLQEAYVQEFPQSAADLTRLLQNMDLATDDGHLNLAGVLLFAERPEWIKPQFILKAIRYPGNTIHATNYVDTEDFSGPLRKIFDGAMAFVMRNLRKVQAGRGVNAPGTSEIPPSVFEELLVNALVHRDYLVSASIRLFIFDDRIEIVSPGHLPNNLTVDHMALARDGYRITFLPVNSEGLLALSDLETALTDDTAIVSLMWANNETSVLFPVQKIGQICRSRRVLFHCDAVQWWRVLFSLSLIKLHNLQFLKFWNSETGRRQLWLPCQPVCPGNSGR